MQKTYFFTKNKYINKMSEVEISSVPEIPCHEPLYFNWNTESFTYTYNAGDLTYEHFFNNHLLKNLPCVIKNITTKWESTKKWIKENGDFNYDYLIQTYGEMEAPVADCYAIDFNSHCKKDMKVKDFLNYMQGTPRNELLYLKDWHLKRSAPNDDFYNVPNLFASDWLNEYSIDTHKDDYMFVYIGPKDSWTPLHVDVFNSYSWSVNLTGRKKWLFFPPGEENKFKDSLRNLPLMYKPGKYTEVIYFEIIQERGDAVFVPSGWHHQVVNEVDTISINHNWVNGCNIILMWRALKESLVNVEQEIQEFKNTPEFFTDCQKMLKLYFGMDFDDFINFLTFIAEKRLAQIQTSSEQSKSLIFNQFYFGHNHLKFDLKNVLNAIELFLSHPDVLIQYKTKFGSNIDMLRTKISEIVSINEIS